MPKTKKDPYLSDPKIVAIKAFQVSDDMSDVRLIFVDHKQKEVPMQMSVNTLDGVLQGLSLLVHKVKQGTPKEISFAPYDVKSGGVGIDESNNVVLYFYDLKDVRINYRLNKDQAQEVFDKLGTVLEKVKAAPPPMKH